MEIRTVNPPKSVSGTTVNMGSLHPKLHGILLFSWLWFRKRDLLKRGYPYKIEIFDYKYIGIKDLM